VVMGEVTPILLLKNSYSTSFYLDRYKGGTYKLKIIPVSGGKTPAVTVGVRIPERYDRLKGGSVQRISTGDTVPLSIGPGQVGVVTLGVPQIAVCTTPRPPGPVEVNYPCAQNRKGHPESARHIEEARQIPPPPITAPLKPGRSAKLLPAGGYERLLTLDRDVEKVVESRRGMTTGPYDCSGVQGIVRPQKDEYPQALFSGNGGNGHVKCITGTDNEGSGSSIKYQLNKHSIPQKDGSFKYFGKLQDGYLVEIVTIP
jgi:hypothetical protein